MPKPFTNLSNILGRPIDENISESDYNAAVNDAMNQGIKNKITNPGDALGVNRKTTNDLTTSYLQDTSPELKLPKDNDITTRDQIQSIYQKLAGGMGQNSVPLSIRPNGPIDPNIQAEYDPNKNGINLYTQPDKNSSIPETLLHELTHSKIQRDFPKAIQGPEEQSLSTSSNETDPEYRFKQTSGEHFGQEDISDLYQYPFKQIKQQLLNKITDPKNSPHYSKPE